MASEYQFPKADNDVFYDGDANAMADIYEFEAGESITAGNVVYIHLTNGEVYVSDTGTANDIRANGIALDSGSDGEIVKVQTKGIYTTSGLTAKQDYYLGASGAVSTTLSAVRIGTAISATRLIIDIRQDDRAPLGTIRAWHEDMTGMPSNMISAFWKSCEGAAISDAESPFNGQNLPDLNTTQSFLRGSTTTGTVAGADTHTHTIGSQGTNIETGAVINELNTTTDAGSTLPKHMTVKWLMKIK
jgi:hypothetical protein